MVIMITGIPGTGKTTTAKELYRLISHGKEHNDTVMLDGNHIRQCWPDIKYSKSERIHDMDNIRSMAKALHDYGRDIIVSTVAAPAIARTRFRKVFGARYMEVLLTDPKCRRPHEHYVVYEPSPTPPELQGDITAKEIYEYYKNK